MVNLMRLECSVIIVRKKHSLMSTFRLHEHFTHRRLMERIMQVQSAAEAVSVIGNDESYLVSVDGRRHLCIA